MTYPGYTYSLQYGFDSKVEAIKFHDYLVENGFERQLSILFNGSNEPVEGVSLHWENDGLKSSPRTLLTITYEANPLTMSKNEKMKK